ncbi:hypothetical protein [Lysinibacillus xylanilyticus]
MLEFIKLIFTILFAPIFITLTIGAWVSWIKEMKALWALSSGKAQGELND